MDDHTFYLAQEKPRDLLKHKEVTMPFAMTYSFTEYLAKYNFVR